MFDWPYSWLQYRTAAPTSLVLGHWFPIWIPEGLSAEPVLDGSADIANFPAGTISAELDVPADDTVLSPSGVRFDVVSGERPRRSYTDGAVGVRDLGVVVMSDAEQVHARVGDSRRRRHRAAPGPPNLDAVADEAAVSVATLGRPSGPTRGTSSTSSPPRSARASAAWSGPARCGSVDVLRGGLPGLGDLGDLGDDHRACSRRPRARRAARYRRHRPAAARSGVDGGPRGRTHVVARAGRQRLASPRRWSTSPLLSTPAASC